MQDSKVKFVTVGVVHENVYYEVYMPQIFLSFHLKITDLSYSQFSCYGEKVVPSLPKCIG